MWKIILGVVVLVVLAGGGYWYMTQSNTPSSTESDSYNQTASTTLPQGDMFPVLDSTSNPSGAADLAPVTTNTNQQKIMNATLHTSMGDITIEFFPQNAPNTVANFIKLAQSGYYDNTKFHRVIKGFMNQGGDPLTKDDSKMAQWGTGGPGYKFNDEISANNSNDLGAVAMANSGPNTNGSQFFINAANNHNLDSGYTVFGHVTQGMDVVSAINNTPTDSSDRPLTSVILKSITLR